MSSGMKERLCRSLEKVLHAETRELPAVAGGILLFFLLIGTFRNLFSLRTPFPASFGKFHCQTGLLQSSRD